MTVDSTLNHGFQTSDTTGAEFRIYQNGKDPIVTKAPALLEFNGRFNAEGANPSIVGLSTSKKLGEAAGTFSVDVKVPLSFERRVGRLFDLIVDDAWCDVVVTKHAKKFHLMRGLIGNVSCQQSASPGASSRTFTISGSDHGAVLASTPIWYNTFAAETPREFSLRVFSRPDGAGDVPSNVVRDIIYGFMSVYGSDKRVNWLLPASMPNRGESFAETFIYDARGFSNDIERGAVNLQLMQANGMPLWAFAKEWSDPAFCELYCDLLPKDDSGSFEPGKSYDVDTTQMGIIFRDRPFPTIANGRQSAWYQLPMVEISPEDVQSSNLGRGGMERFNTFRVSPQLLMGTKSGLDLTGPLWDTADIEQHGMRQFNVESRYVAAPNDLFTMAESLRTAARDWHCLNPYFFNGSITLGNMHPNIRVGTRLRILGETEDTPTTFYVEQVSHRVNPSGKASSTLGVTRGWTGTDSSYFDALTTMALRYSTLTSKGLQPAEGI